MRPTPSGTSAGTPTPCARARDHCRCGCTRVEQGGGAPGAATATDCCSESGCASTDLSSEGREREADTDAPELDERHRREIFARAPRGLVGALLGLVAQRAADDLGPVDNANRVVIDAAVEARIVADRAPQ